MARDSFLMYTEWANQINRLSDEQAGILLKAIFAYNKGEQMHAMDDKTDMCFSFIQGQLDRDSRKYADVCDKRREAGKKGGVANATKRKQMLPIANFAKQTVANQADNDNENENEYENDNEKSKRNNECITAWGRAQRESDDENPDEDWDLRHREDCISDDDYITTTDGRVLKLKDLKFPKNIKVGVTRR